MLFSHISKQMYNNVQHSQNKYFADDVDFYAVYSTVYRNIATLPRWDGRENLKDESMSAHGLESSRGKLKAPHTKTDKESIWYFPQQAGVQPLQGK